MPLQITHRKESEVPAPSSAGSVNPALVILANEMTKLAKGMVLEIETGDEKSVRATKGLITRAGNQLGTPWHHWHVGTTVYAKPKEAAQPGKQRSERSNLRDYRQ